MTEHNEFLSVPMPIIITPQKMLYIDACGAFLSALALVLVLPAFDLFIGLPDQALYLLGLIAVCLFLYSFNRARVGDLSRALWLWIIACANLAYCAFTVLVLAVYREDITLFGMVYFMGELVIILLLVRTELRVIRDHYSGV